MIKASNDTHVPLSRADLYHRLWEAQRYLDAAFTCMTRADELNIYYPIGVRGLWYQAMLAVRNARETIALLLDAGLGEDGHKSEKGD